MLSEIKEDDVVHSMVMLERCRVDMFGVFDPSVLTVYRCFILGGDLEKLRLQCWGWVWFTGSEGLLGRNWDLGLDG